MRLRTLGELCLASDEGVPLLRGRRRELVLLAYLARRTPRAVSRADLATLFWHDRPVERARLSLRQTLFKLRQLIPSGLEVTPEHVRLDPAAVSVDVARLEHASAAGEHELALRELGGEFLPEAEDAGGEEWRLWLEGERAALRRLFARTLDALITDATARGAWPEAVALAQRWSEAMPDDVEAHRRLTDALVLAGRGTEATARHAAFMARRQADGEAPTHELHALGARLERAARAAPASPGSAALFSPDMVGRGDAFAELTGAWTEARAGHHAVVVIEGEPGIGKSRLVAELLRAVARARGAAIRLHARAYGQERPTDHGIARELLAPLAAARGLAGAPPQALAGLATLLPEVRERYPHLPEAPDDERALAAAVARVLGDVAAEQPVLLVVDDLGAADVASRRLILGVLRRLAEAAVRGDPHGGSLLAVLTTRPGALSRADLRDTSPPRWIRLRPLDVAQIEALLVSMLELPAPERRALAERLHGETGGNPFDVIEIVSALVDEGLLAPDDSGTWSARTDLGAEGPALPHSGREALLRRLGRLDADAGRLLEAAARHRTPFDAAIGAQLTGLDPAAVGDALERLLLRRLVRRSAADAARYEVAHPLIAELAAGGAEPSAAPVHRTRWRVALAAATVAIAVIGALVASDRLGARPSRPPAIMVADVRADARDSGAVWMAEGVARLIEARLSQTESVEPIPSDRVREATARAGYAPESLTARQAVTLARRLGADLVATGRIRRAGPILLLDLEIRDARDGELARRVVVEGRDALELADAAAVQLWQSSGFDGERPRLSEVTTRSAEAYRQFIRSRAAQAAGHAGEQVAALDAAIALDSGFGSALLERITLARGEGDTATVRRLSRAFERNRGRIPLRDRLQWQASVSLLEGSPVRAESALRSLVQRYPRDPRAYRDLAELRATQGRWKEAEAVTQSALALDSSAIELGTGICVPCLEYARLVGYRVMEGDREGAEVAARRLVALLPGTPGAWVNRAFVDASYGRHDAAVSAMRRAMSLGGNDPWLQLLYGRVLVMGRRLDEADSLVAAWRAAGAPVLVEQADDLESVVAFERGDERRALRVLDAALARNPQSSTFLLVRAHHLGRRGRYREAERLLEQHAHRAWSPGDETPSAARAFAWEHALLADAIAGSADTTRLLALADSIQRIGAHSYYGRDWRLHHHVRGLVAMRGGRFDDAIRELEQARFGRPGWTRTTVELAKAYLAVGRPHDAIRTLRTGYEGWPDAMARYASRAELDRMMAVAFNRIGMRDSAAVYASR